MSEGRRSQVILLDERRLDIIIQSRLYAGELLDIVASHFNLKEKEYFGIAYIDDTGQYSWLQLDKRVLEHDFPKKFSAQGATLVFNFKVKYFIESITQLRDSATIEAFYLQAKSLVSKGELEIDSDITFQLAALVIQATYGDYSDEEAFKVHLKRLPVLPTATLKESSSIGSCEDGVLEHYKSLVGQTRGDAIVNYLSILESLPTYGQHYYELKDKSGSPCWLGLSYRGISQYDKNDRRTPKRVFLWKQLENLYFRDRKFTVEVHEARRVVHTLSSFNLYEDAIEEPVEEFDDLSSAICDPTTQVSVSRRALAPANVTVYVWYAASPNIAKCIWSMAIAQHQFYLDRNHRKSRNCVVRNLSQIASELSRSVQSLSSASSQSNISRSTSSASLPTIIIEGELSEESKAATVEMLTALQSRKDALEDALKKKTEELKALCLKEGELTGELPPETPFHPGEPQPQVRRRIGTSFTLSDKIICRAKSKDRETINNLELDYEIQSKIASAAFRLANDLTARKSVRKLRKVSYQQATSKLKDIEEKLCTLKREKVCQKDQDSSSNDTVDADSRLNLVGLPNSSSENSIIDRNQSNSPLNGSSVPPSSSLPQLTEGACVSAPPSPAKCRQRHQSLQHVITNDVYEDVPLPFNVRARRNSSTYSAASEYDTISCGSSSIASLGLPYRNRFEANLDIEGTNHYSVPNRRASQAFNDPDDLLLDNRSQDTLDRSYVNENTPNIYVNASALSSSYDERLSYNQSGDFSVIPDTASLAESNFDQGFNENTLNYNDSGFKLTVPYELSRVENFNHSHSENSLHRVRANSVLQKLDQMHISEPELNVDISEKENFSHVYSVPMLRNNRPPRATAYVNSLDCSGVTEQSINQVADLVQASVLLQNCKRTMSSNSLQHCSPKAKTKEWVETSLDSPVLTKKRKPKPPEVAHSVDHIQPVAEWLENGLPSVYVNDSFVPYQTQFYENELPSHVTLRSSPTLHHMHNRVACPPSYRHSAIFPSQIPSEHSPSGVTGLFSNRNQYNHYENASEIARNTNSYHTLSSSSFYETIQKDCHLSESNLLSVNTGSNETLIEHPSSVQFEDSPLLIRTIAEPQQPTKHPNRRINMSDVCVNENISLSDEPDYQNIPMDHQFESSNYRATPHCTTFPEIHCDIPDPNHQYHQELPHHSEPQELCDNYDTATNEQLQSWPQFSPTSTIIENSVMPPSTIPQNVNFSPTVEVNVVSLGHYQPYWEETKPYELSDFYKYSTKHRKQKPSTSDTNHAQSPLDVKQSTDKKLTLYHDHVQLENSVMHKDYNLPVHPVNHNQHELITNHVPVFGNVEQLESPAKYYDGNCTSTPPNQGEQDKSLSFGELDLGISLADTFHDEMVAWYQKQDNVKKATLV